MWALLFGAVVMWLVIAWRLGSRLERMGGSGVGDEDGVAGADIGVGQTLDYAMWSLEKPHGALIGWRCVICDAPVAGVDWERHVICCIGIEVGRSAGEGGIGFEPEPGVAEKIAFDSAVASDQAAAIERWRAMRRAWEQGGWDGGWGPGHDAGGNESEPPG